MAATDRSGDGNDAGAVAARCREAEFLHLVARADGEALAAAGTLAGACGAVGTPYQVSAVRTRSELDDRLDSIESATPLVVGASATGVETLTTGSIAVRAYEAASALGADPDPTTALAGVVAGGGTPGRVGGAALADAGVERRAGLAIPTTEVGDVAHSTLVHAAFSGDPEAACEAFAGVEEVASREAASLLALSVAGDAEATERAATAVEHAVHPHPSTTLATVGGYADVLCALARTAPGLGVALALGGDVGEAALSAWRERARRVHGGVRSAETARYAGVVVARTAGPVEPVARLLRDFRAPEPTVLAVGDGEAAVAGLDPVGDAIEVAADRVGGSALARGDRGYARFPAAEAEAFVDALRGEL